MKKYLLIMPLLLIASIPFFTHAALAPTLLVNDSLKECQWYFPVANEELNKGWHTAGVKIQDRQNDPESMYCNSLGYTLQQNENVATVKPIFKIIIVVFWLIFISLIYVYYRFFIKNSQKRKYVLFVLCLIITATILVCLYPLIIYQIEPCASGFISC